MSKIMAFAYKGDDYISRHYFNNLFEARANLTQSPKKDKLLFHSKIENIRNHD